MKDSNLTDHRAERLELHSLRYHRDLCFITNRAFSPFRPDRRSDHDGDGHVSDRSEPSRGPAGNCTSNAGPACDVDSNAEPVSLRLRVDPQGVQR